MNTYGVGKYDLLYDSSSSQLWPPRPGRVLKWASNYFPEIDYAVDLGCGDGKNALFLAEAGIRVECYDVSESAKNCFEQRFSKTSGIIQSLVKFQLEDAININLANDTYDCAVFYGVAHCLAKGDLDQIFDQLYRSVKLGGYICFCSLNSDHPMPEKHGTGTLYLRDHFKLLELFSNMIVLRAERGTIQETHPGVEMHQHGVTWILAQKN